MAEVAEVRAPVENVNDQTVAILRWVVENGSYVKAGDSLLLAETSKAVVEIEAPRAGWLWQVAEAGTEVPTGSILCYVGDEVAALETAARSAAASAADAQPTLSLASSPDVPAEGAPTAADVRDVPSAGQISVRFSGKARTLIQQLGLDPAAFSGRGLVRAEDVQAYADGRAGRPVPPRDVHAGGAAPIRGAQAAARHPDGTMAGHVPARAEKLSKSKRLEAILLRAAVAQTITSSVTVRIPAGRVAPLVRQADVPGLFSAVVVFETARLLRLHPVFNAFAAGDAVHYYQDVNIGYAMDQGQGLRVPVVREADRKSVLQIVEEKQRMLVDYLTGSLSPERLQGGTFTITDLSDDDVLQFQPIINEGQSAILGICGSVAVGPESSLNLVLCFDHQVAEGRSAAAFLRELRERLVAHAESLAPPVAAAGAEARCSVCLRPLGELEADRHFLVRTRTPAGADDRDVCTICLADW